jgi:PAS domain S-box-containing protein
MVEPSSPTRPPDWINFVETSIVVVDQDELITGWNRKTTEILGYSAQDLVGTKLEHISPSFALSFGWLAEVK